MLRKFRNYSEDRVQKQIRAMIVRHGAELHEKVRVADVVNIDMLDRRDLGTYSLQSHFDFVLIDESQQAVVAIEFDGPGHKTSNDEKKNSICSQANLPLFRIYEGAFLIFDEADSLLANRAFAARSWEVSQVNEMLTWMESHPLPFACTTNLADHLDPATRRRFTINAELRSLSAPQLGIAFRKFFEAEPPGALFDLEGLTPGDLAAIARRCRLLGEQDISAILEALVDEAQTKESGGIRPGFRPAFEKSNWDTKR